MTFLRQGWNFAYFGVPAGALWYLAIPYYVTWRNADIVNIYWLIATEQVPDGLWEHLGWGFLMSLGFALLTSAIAFLWWIFFVLSADLYFTRFSVVILAIGFLLIGLSCTAAPYFFIYWLLPTSLGAALVILETRRMAGLDAAY